MGWAPLMWLSCDPLQRKVRELLYELLLGDTRQGVLGWKGYLASVCSDTKVPESQLSHPHSVSYHLSLVEVFMVNRFIASCYNDAFPFLVQLCVLGRCLATLFLPLGNSQVLKTTTAVNVPEL